MDTFDGTTIEIVNWEKYNPRKDLKATSWVRLQNSLFDDPNFIEFDQPELLFWIYLLSMASKKQSGRIKFSLPHAIRIGRFIEPDVNAAIRKLIGVGCIKIDEDHVTQTLRERDEDVTPTLRAQHTTNERTNETNEILVSTEAEKESASGAIDEFSNDDEIKNLLKPIRQSTQLRWIKLYTDPLWIQSEFLKAITWLENNPQKAPKSKMARFLGNWLSRGWEQYRKTIPSNSGSRINTKPINIEDLL